MANTGKRANWMQPYTGDRPRDVLQLTEAQEAKTNKFIGFSGADQNGNAVEQFFLSTDETTVNFADYTSVPVGTILFTPKVTGVAFYQRINNATGTSTDWNKVVKAAV